MILMATRADVGGMVRYFKRGWRFAKLVKLGRKWGKVLHPVSGRHRIPARDIESFTAWALANPSGQDVKHGKEHYAKKVTDAVHQGKPQRARPSYPARVPRAWAERSRAPQLGIE